MDGGPLNGRRVAVYARFSSDKQSDASIEDQVHRAREWIRSHGGDPDLAQVLTDFAVSGASMDRPGMRMLEDAIRRGSIDLVVTESVDRISRDVEDAARSMTRALERQPMTDEQWREAVQRVLGGAFADALWGEP